MICTRDEMGGREGGKRQEARKYVQRVAVACRGYLTSRITLFLMTPLSVTSKRKAVHIRVVLVWVSMTT